MNVVIFSNAPIKRITDALNLPFSPKEGWVSAAIAMLQTVECNIFYVFPQRKTKEVIKGKIENIQYYGYPKTKRYDCNGVQREHNKKLNNGLPILHKVPPKRDYGRYFCILAEKGGTSHGGLTEKLSPFFYAQKQEVNAYGR